ncbi:MAG TPA: hypothetical protein VMW17_07870 [Candidatus Binatia bacterium]|nr:hypothetical protein [Candidatus Binatia bacterium]
MRMCVVLPLGDSVRPVVRAFCAVHVMLLLAAIAITESVSPRAAHAQTSGDANCDGHVDAQDIPALIDALFNPSDCPSADGNQDGIVSAADLPALILAAYPAPPPSSGPIVSFFGLAGAAGNILAPDGIGDDGWALFVRPAGVGFKLVIEGTIGTGGKALGRTVSVQTGRPDLQIESQQVLGDGSFAQCPAFVPAIDPPDFGPGAPIDAALQAFACGFDVITTRAAACTLDSFGNANWAATASQMQFCLQIGSRRQFPTGQTRLSVRLRDVDGNLGPLQSIVVQIGTAAPATRTPTPTRSVTATASITPSATTILTATPTVSATATPTITRSVTATLTTRIATPNPTVTILAATASPTASASTRPTTTRTATATASLALTATPLVTSTAPKVTPSPTASRTVTPSPTRTATASATRSASPPNQTASPTATRTNSATLTVTRTATGSPIATGTPTRSPTRTTTQSATASPTATRTFTRTPTRTPTPTATGAAGSGPLITYFGVANANDTIATPIATTTAGIPIYKFASGFGFTLVVEGRVGSSGRPINGSTYNTDPQDPTQRPGLQVEVSLALGNGSATVCDNQLPNPGGVPAVSPANFSVTQTISDALNDLGCRFVDGTGKPGSRGQNDACTQFPDGTFAFVCGNSTNPNCTRGASTLQFCGPINRPLTFTAGDTVVTVRLLDTSGNPGPQAQLIIRR